jgi:hypothetical protein
MAGVSAPDPVQRYLTQLRASLRTAEAGRILAEAEDHLRETVSAGLAAGLSHTEAREAAVSAFGSVRAVVRAHQTRPGRLFRGRTPRAVLGDLFLSAWKLGGAGLAAIGASGVVVALMNVTLGRPFTGQAPAGVVFSKADCAYWMAGWPGAHTCATAAMLEASSDAVILRLAAGVGGLVALGAYGVVRRVVRGPAPLLAGYFPLLAAAVFGAGALALALAQLTGFTVQAGPGVYLSGALVAAVVAVCYGVRARPALRHLVTVWARRARAR